MAASADRAWTCGDPWQYVACLPGQHFPCDPFHVTDVGTPTLARGKGKRLLDQEGERGAPRAPPKKQKKGVCRLHNTATGGCPYGRECIFIHRCTGCGAMDEHGRMSCTASPITVAPVRGGQEYPISRQGPAPRNPHWQGERENVCWIKRGREEPQGLPRRSRRRASAGLTTPLQGVARMAGSAYSYIGALVVGPWTSMAACLA